MLGLGRGRWAVFQKHTLIHFFYVNVRQHSEDDHDGLTDHDRILALGNSFVKVFECDSPVPELSLPRVYVGVEPGRTKRFGLGLGF